MNLTIERYFKVRFQALIAEVNQCHIKIAEQKMAPSDTAVQNNYSDKEDTAG